jgi:hypothetical protein
MLKSKRKDCADGCAEQKQGGQFASEVIFHVFIYLR